MLKMHLLSGSCQYLIWESHPDLLVAYLVNVNRAHNDVWACPDSLVV